MKRSVFFCLLLILAGNNIMAQSSNSLQQFWNQLEKHCGKSYEGTITAGARDGDGFTGQQLVMQVFPADQ